MNIEELGLSQRAYNCLKRAGIDTVQQLKKMSAQQLAELKGMGTVCLAEILDKTDFGKGMPVPDADVTRCSDCTQWVRPELPGAEINWGVCRKIRGHYPQKEFFCGYAMRRCE